MSKLVLLLTFVNFFSSCIQTNSPDDNSLSPTSDTQLTNKSPKTKTFRTQKKVVHNFTAVETIKVPPTLLNDNDIKKIAISNKKGTYRLVIDKVDLLNNSKLMVPISEFNEEISISGIK